MTEMKRNTFGDARPKGMDEIIEAMNEKEAAPDEVNAELSKDGDYDPANTDAVNMTGWTAEVRENDSGDEVFTTQGYATMEELVADLKAAGIHDYSEQ